MGAMEYPRGTIHRAYAEHVYPTLDPGSVSLVISDGPYAMRKAGWDRMRVEDLPDWYRPHVEAWGRVCAPSASVYVWGTDASASELRPLMREHGWTLRVRVVWDKAFTPATIGWRNLTTWADATEVCDVYTRGEPTFCPTQGEVMNVWRLHDISWRDERLRGGMVPHKCRRGELSHETLHPCQKPLAFYDRIIRASSRPGDLILEPFGGTCRAALACERMTDAEARRYVCVEPDEDGRDYLAAVHRELTAETRRLDLFRASEVA